MYYDSLESFGIKRKVGLRSLKDKVLEQAAYHSGEIVEMDDRLFVFSDIITEGYHGDINYSQKFADKVYETAKQYELDISNVYFNIFKLENMEIAIALFDISLKELSKYRKIYVKTSMAPIVFIKNGLTNISTKDNPYFLTPIKVKGSGQYFNPEELNLELPLQIESYTKGEALIEDLPYYVSNLIASYHDSLNVNNARRIDITRLLQNLNIFDNYNSLKINKINGELLFEIL